GVVIALMTPVVNALVTKTACGSSGFIAGFFFPGDLDLSASPDSSNHGEVFYSIVADPTATLSCAHTSGEVDSIAPGTFVHELQHMINYAQHVVLRAGSPEDGWLDEGLSKYGEEIAGRRYLALTPPDNGTFSLYAFNDVDDAYKYLSATGASPLLIEFDQGTLAEVGASWLFTRYLVDQYGAALPGRLVQTTLAGAANVAAQTGHRFDTTVTRWALSNWVSDLPGFATPPELSDTSWHFRTRTFLSLYQHDSTTFPVPYPLVPSASAGSAVSLSGTLRSGSRRPSITTRRAGPARSRSRRPSPSRTSATCRSPTHRAWRSRAARSPPARTTPTPTLPRATWSPWSPTGRPCSASATSGRSPASR